MKIKTAVSTPRLSATRGGPWWAILKILLIVLLLSGAIYAALAHVFTKNTGDQIWKWAHDHGHAALRSDISLRNAVWKMPKRIIESVGRGTVPKLTIDIKFKHAQKLRKKRAEALAKGLLVQTAEDFVPASIRHGDKSTKVKLRLKGDLLDHLEGNKWSFRIHTKGKDHILGMRRFSLQHPKVRGFHGEALFFETLRHFGVLAPRYLFVDVTVNGEAIGLMALEEHFSKELLEANSRRESVIVRFDESLYWDEGSRRIPEGRRSFNVYQNALIDAFGSSRITKSEKLSEDYALAVGLLRGFVEGRLPASSVFDPQLLGRFLAVAEFWGSWHSVRWHNQRFYLNPITARLEPIGFDATLQGRRDPHQVVAEEVHLAAAMLQDPVVFVVYRDTLRALSKEIIDGDFRAELRELEQQHLAVLRKEFFFLEELPKEELRNRANKILERGIEDWKAPIVARKSEASIPIQNYPLLVHASLVKGEKGTYLELANAIPHDVEVQSIVWKSKGEKPDVVFQAVSSLQLPLRLPEAAQGSVRQYHRFYYDALEDSDYNTLDVTAVIYGFNEPRTAAAKVYYGALSNHPVPVSTVEEQLSHHKFLILNRKERSFTVRQGTWQVDDLLIVPLGFNLRIPAGTRLQFAPTTSLIAHGPLHIEGRDGDRVVLEGLPGKDEKGLWQGVAVLSAATPSRWSNVTVRNTTGVERVGWRLTGGVNFYRSDIQMENCILEGNKGEDALNIIHARFEFDNVRVMNTASDGFDSDFSDGSIKKGLFELIGTKGGGDGIDLSGSRVTVTGTQFREISDKALSVGEQSKMEVREVVIDSVGTAAASKDGSILRIEDSTIGRIQNVGLMAFIKKPEFGSAHINAKNLTFDGSAPIAVAQTGSTIVIDNEVVEERDVDVEQLYKTIMKPGLRR